MPIPKKEKENNYRKKISFSNKYNIWHGQTFCQTCCLYFGYHIGINVNSSSVAPPKTFMTISPITLGPFLFVSHLTNLAISGGHLCMTVKCYILSYPGTSVDCKELGLDNLQISSSLPPQSVLEISWPRGKKCGDMWVDIFSLH